MALIYRSLFRRRVLVVEDSFFLASHIADILEDVGASIVGPVPTEEQALEVAQSMDLNAAVFNSIICGKRSDRLGESLRTRGISSLVLNLTGRDDADPLLRDHAVLQWPFDSGVLVEMVSALVTRPTPGTPRHPLNCLHAR